MRFMMRFFSFFFLIIALFSLSSCGSDTPTGNVAQITIEGGIGPAVADYVDQSIKQANKAGDKFIILRVDTPGGLVSSTDNIIKSIQSSDIPVIGFVAPAGARAASAGTFIMYACPYAVMAPSTNIGSASPVSLTPSSGDNKSSGDEDVLKKKLLNDLVAKIKGLAETNGRNKEWAQKAVTDADNITATQALKTNVINAMAQDNDDLLKKLSGVSVRVKEKSITLDTSNAKIYPLNPNWRMRFLMVITNPNVTYILILAGLLGLGIELFNPGLIFPGVFGGICLLTAGYALQLLPVNYVGVALIMLGVGFFVAEVFVSSFGALAIGGIIATSIGSIMLVHRDLPGFGVSWIMTVSVALVLILLVLALVFLIAKDMTKPKRTGEEVWLGQAGTVKIVDGQCWLSCRGQLLKIDNTDGLEEGQEVTVKSRKGARVVVE